MMDDNENAPLLRVDSQPMVDFVKIEFKIDFIGVSHILYIYIDLLVEITILHVFLRQRLKVQTCYEKDQIQVVTCSQTAQCWIQ